MKPLQLLIPTLVIFFSCQHPFGHAGPALTASSMYNIDSVQLALEGGDESPAAKKFSQGIDLYKNKKNAAASIPFFKDAILIYPSAKSYFELGSALLDAGYYDESARALHIAEQLNYSPLANVMFKLASAYAPRKGRAAGANPAGDDSLALHDAEEAGSDSLALHYMEVAIQMGYAHPEQFLQQSTFSLMKERYLFHIVYNRALSGGGGSKGLDRTLWQSFCGEFPGTELPLVINADYIAKHQPEQSISYDYEKFIPEMRTAKFSREVEFDYYYCSLIRKDAVYTALLYAGVNHFLTDAKQNNPVFYLLATYDPNGRIIDKIAVAGQDNFDADFKIFTMQPNYSFVIQDYKMIYQSDPKTVGYDSNYAVGSEPLASKAYIIGPNGRFQQQPNPLALR